MKDDSAIFLNSILLELNSKFNMLSTFLHRLIDLGLKHIQLSMRFKICIQLQTLLYICIQLETLMFIFLKCS